MVASVVEYKFEVMKIFVDKFIKVDFLFSFFLFLAFFLHLVLSYIIQMVLNSLGIDYRRIINS